jgi:glutamyl-tRNA synthetase
MNAIVRFAPSPTGYLHIGNARTALFNWLYTLREGGKFILRLDDTDLERSKKEYAQAIVEDLNWLGIIPQLIVAQSERIALYDAAVERLKSAGRLYPCYEEQDELERRRKRQLARGFPPVYDRAALRLNPEERAKLESEGRKPHWRFLLHPGKVAFNDLVRGPVEIDAESLSDPVLVRADGSYLYTLPSVVDDIDMGITHVIRGEDHVANTGVQIQLFEALGGKAPIFAHHNLLTSASGEGLSKRSGALSLRSLRESGLEPMAVACLATLTGSSEDVKPYSNLKELSQHIDFAHISKSAAKFDPNDLTSLNATFLHAMPYKEAEPRLEDLGIKPNNEAFWNAVRANLKLFSDIRLWADIISLPKHAVIADPAFIAEAERLLPPAPWSTESWKEWTSAIKEKTGRKGKELFQPLRLALTGLEHGPDMAHLLPLIAPEVVQKKLRASH